MADDEVRMIMSVYPGAMTGFAALNSGLVSINNVFLDFTRQMDANFGLIDSAIVTTGVVVAQLGFEAMDAFGKFEQGMKIVQMVSGQTKSDIEQLSQTANQFSVQYRMDIDQITDGLQTLGRAGLNSASEQAEVLENGLNTAKLEGRELNSVLEELIQNTALLGGDLNSSDFGEQSAYVNDLLVATSMTAPITTHDVSETLKYSGGIAAAAGANITSDENKYILEDYMASIAAFARKGVTGSIAGTALRAFFNKPATQDSSVTEALASIKLKPEYLWEEDEETMKPVSQQIAIIQGQMDKLNVSTMDRLQIWSKIVGGKMGQQMMKLNSEDIKELTSDIRSAESASNLAAGSMKTYEANLKAASESAEALKRNVGGALVTMFNPILEVLNKVLGFAQQDVMGWPIAIGILGFIGLAGSRAKRILSQIKKEIQQIIADGRAGILHFMTKGGYERNRKGEWVKKPEEEKETVKSQTEESLKDIYKRVSSKYSTIDALKDLSDEEKSVYYATRNWTKSTIYGGMGDNKFFEMAAVNHLLNESDYAKILSGGSKGSIIANLGEERLEELRTEIDKLLQTTKDLSQTEEKRITVEEQAVRQAEAHASALNTFEEEREGIKKDSINLSGLRVVESTRNGSGVLVDSTIGASGPSVKNKTLPKINYNPNSYDSFMSFFVSELEKQIPETSSLEKATFLDTETDTKKIIQLRDYYSNNVEKFLFKIKAYQKSIQLPLTKIAEDFVNFKVPNISKEEFGNYALDDTHKISDLIHGKEFDKLYNQFTKHIENNLRGYMEYVESQLSTHVKKTYPTFAGGHLPNLETMEWNDFRKFAKSAGVSASGTRNEIMTRLKERYGNELSGGHILDWETMNWNDFRKFAKSEGVSASGTRDEIIARLNEKYENELSPIAKNWLDDFDNVANELEGVHQENQRLIDDIERMRQEVADLKAIREEKDKQREDLDNWDPNEEAKKRRESRDELTRIEGEKTAQRLGVKKDLETLDQTQERLHRDLKEQEEKTLKQQISVSEDRYKNALKQSLEENSLSNKLKKQVESIANQNILTNPERFLREKLGKIIDSGAPTDVYRNYNINGQTIPLGPFTPINLEQLKEEVETEKNSGVNGFLNNLKKSIGQSREGQRLSFGTGLASFGKEVTTTKQKLAVLGNQGLNVADMFGGPLFVGMQLFSVVISLVQKAFQDYCEDLQEAQSQLQDAYSQWNQAEDSLKQSFEEQNPNASSEEINDMILDTYATMGKDMEDAFKNGADEWFKKVDTAAVKLKEYEYDEEKDDGSTVEVEEAAQSVEEAIKENTGALYVATSALNMAMSKYVNIANDTTWGLDGLSTQLSDIGATPLLKTLFPDDFTDNSEFLLTASQKDENYAGYTDLAGLLLEDIKDAKGDLAKGLTTALGPNSAGTLLSRMSEENRKAWEDQATFIKGLGAANNARLQVSMKYDSKTWRSLAKELAKQDSKLHSAGVKNDNKNSKRIEGLVNKLNSSMGGHFSKTQVLQAAYLYQLQDMYAVTQSSIVPIITQNAQLSANTLAQTTNVNGNVQGTGANTYSTYATAATIANLVAILAETAAADAAWNRALTADPGTAADGSDATDINGDGESNLLDREIIELAQNDDIKSGQDFMKAASKKFNTSQKGVSLFDTGADALNALLEPTVKSKGYSVKAGAAPMLYIDTVYGADSKMVGYGYSTEAANEFALNTTLEAYSKGLSSRDILKTFSKNYTENPRFIQNIVDTYLAATEDEGGDSGSGSGSGSGSDTGDTDSGTKKERVDLVLCNKKEIPKLNVNLFKKPPTFTVLNKNFKVRDIKINSEDTPKAIMSSIKNAFIDVQKRTDPKIIQDEEAEYDPLEATDGNPLPSGTAKTKTT